MPNPYIILAAIVFAVVAFFQGIHYQKLEDAAAIAALNEKARNVESQLVSDANAKATKLKEENDKANQAISTLKSDIASGRMRLSIRSVQSAETAGTATGASTATRCDINPEDAQSLIAITSEGDEAIRQLSALQDFYNETKAKLDKGVQQ